MKRAIILGSLLAMAACVPVPPPPPVPQAMAVLQQAAAAYRAGGAVAVHVTGHADTSGPVRYNQRLSDRRARHVSDALVHMGVPAQTIAFGGVGENDLAVPTPDGVREPRNRRVTVVE